jgi:carbon-monoxide dehydrogenase catalytic subunit
MEITGSQIVTNFVTNEIEDITGGKWAFEDDPIKAAHIMMDHIDKKRKALNLTPMIYKQEYAVAV